MVDPCRLCYKQLWSTVQSVGGRCANELWSTPDELRDGPVYHTIRLGVRQNKEERETTDGILQ